MELAKILKVDVVSPVLKNNGFKKVGGKWYKSSENGILYLLRAKSESIIAKNNFLFRIEYGVYFQGVTELLYGFPFDLNKDDVGASIITDSTQGEIIKKLWDTGKMNSVDELREEIIFSLEQRIIPLLTSIDTGEKLLNSLVFNMESYIKKDSVLALKLACVTYLIGRKQEGVNIVKDTIAFYKNNYEFAEKARTRMERGFVFEYKQL